MSGAQLEGGRLNSIKWCCRRRGENIRPFLQVCSSQCHTRSCTSRWWKPAKHSKETAKGELRFWTCKPSYFTFPHLSHLSISSLFLRSFLLRTLQLDSVIEHDRHSYRWLSTWKSSIAVMVNNNHRSFLSSLKEIATLHGQFGDLDRPECLQSSLYSISEAVSTARYLHLQHLRILSVFTVRRLFNSPSPRPYMLLCSSSLLFYCVCTPPSLNFF